MPPKVKSSTPLPPEAMAMPHPSECVAQQCGPPEPLPTTKRRNTVKRRRATDVSTDTDSSQAAATRTPKRGTSCGKSKTVKEKRGKHIPAPGTPRGRPTQKSLFISAVATKCSVHQHVVEQVLRAVEAVAVQTLKDKRKFNVSFIQGRLNEKPEAPAREKKMLGKIVSVPARPAKMARKFTPAKEFRMLFE